MNEGYQRFGATITALYAELDWAKLGACYCEGDGSSFFDDELRERMLDVGFLLADTIGDQVDEHGPRRSLYIGAAVAELAPILAERLVLDREIVWLNLAGDETTELQRALRIVGDRLGFELPVPSTAPIQSCAAGAFDHLWMVSVLTDPDAFPALHDHLYERSGGPLATGRGSLTDDSAGANELIERWLDCAANTAILTTTDEERSMIEPAVRRRGGEWFVPDECHESAIVGDMVRVCRWSR